MGSTFHKYFEQLLKSKEHLGLKASLQQADMIGFGSITLTHGINIGNQQPVGETASANLGNCTADQWSNHSIIYIV